MTWIDIQNELIQDFMKLTQTLKDLAPKNSTYQSRDNGKLVDYIYVDGKRTRSNTNNLYNSIGFDIELLKRTLNIFFNFIAIKFIYLFFIFYIYRSTHYIYS